MLELNGIVKQYGGLRPLRLSELRIGRGERVTIAGLDAPAAQVLVNLVTGAGLPDQGTVRVLGEPTSELSADGWLTFLDRFGIVSQRAVLLEGSTLEQNLAMPFTLEIDPVPAEVAARVRSIASRCGIVHESMMGMPAGELPPEVRARIHLARAIALDPALLLLEHPTADLPPPTRADYGADVGAAAAAAGTAVLALTNDEGFAAAIGGTQLKLEPATGRLMPARRTGWWR